MGIQYLNEHLMFGKIGNAFVVLSFTASIVAMLSYAFQVYRKEEESLSWNKLARFSFFIHACSVFGIISLLFYLIQSHYFEYYYVWQHSSTTLPEKYMWACLWEGQEGSFLIWTVWHVVLSILLVWKGKKWETCAVHDRQALVLVNHAHAKGNEIWDLSSAIVADILEKFQIELEREVNVY